MRRWTHNTIQIQHLQSLCHSDTILYFFSKLIKPGKNDFIILQPENEVGMSFNTNNFLRHVSLDCVVFGFHSGQLKVLLLHMKHSGQWALPGGFVQTGESLETAAMRVLNERTGLSDIFLEQFRVFSDPGRSIINPALTDIMETEAAGIATWFEQRFISVGFYALVEYSKVEPKPDRYSDQCVWKDLDKVGTLMMDHNLILEKALSTLRRQLNYQPVGLNLLPPTFTMPELQKLYEAILGKELDRRNFQRKMLSYKILNKLGERKEGQANKAPFLYEFHIENYRKALENGLSGNW